MGYNYEGNMMHDTRSLHRVGLLPRGVAFRAVCVFLVATVVGSVLPEFGNLAAVALGLQVHTFNVVFLSLGIIGVGMALHIGLAKSR